MDIKLLIRQQIEKLNHFLNQSERVFGENIFNTNGCQVLSQSAVRFELMVDTQSEEGQVEYMLQLFEEDIIPSGNGDRSGWNRFRMPVYSRLKMSCISLIPKNRSNTKNTREKG